MSIAKKGFDFSIHIAELVKYLRDDNLNFPLCDRLLYCGVQTGLACRELESGGKSQIPGSAALAVTYAAEADYIIEMAAAAGYLTKQQSVLIRADCESITKIVRQNI